MKEEIPFNPPGLSEYIRDGARKNSAILRKMQGKATAPETAEAKPGSVQPDCSTAGTMRIEINLKIEPSEYGGAVHLRIMRAIEAVFPDVKNRSASRITWEAEP